MIGQPLGHYRILARLGAGGMGEVYRAHDDRLDRDVAIKLLLPGAVEDATARARLLREARAAASLNHSCICTVHEVGEADGRAYIAMELVEGQPLSERVRGRALPVAEALQYGVQIARALEHAHARQIVHRDLKSANVLVAADGRVKVLDFGLAKKMSGQELADAVTGEEALAALTEPGVLVGTIAYMSPEQLRGAPADARSDIWALGVVLYEMVAGMRPFTGHSSFEVSSRILNDPPSPFPTAVPAAVRALIQKCLEKDPARRCQTASEVTATLDAIDVERPAPWAGLRYGMSRRPRLAVAAALLAAGVVATALTLEPIRSRWRGAAPRVQSLAVLPLQNLSGDAAQDYFADGITEVLTTDLARLGGIGRVTARGSVVAYKGTSKSLAEIARELNVDALVTGSVLRSGDRVSITAQLLDPATGEQLWTNRYERDLRDVLRLLDDIVSAIVQEIRAELSPDDETRLAAARPVNPEAFQAYLQGRFHWYRQTREDYDLAERYFELARQKDPDYALAYAGLASVWMMRGDAGFQPPADTFPRATAFMERALELVEDESLSDVYVLLGNHRAATEWDWQGAVQAYEQALAQNPNDASARFFYADMQIVLKRPEAWRAEMERALALDPLNGFNRSYYGWHLNYLRRWDDAIPVFQDLLPKGPNKAANYLGLWGAYHRKGLHGQAIAAAKEYFIGAGDGEFATELGAGESDAAYRAGMRRTGEAMIEGLKRRHVPAIRIARMFAHAGDNDTALQWLETAYKNRESALMRLGVFWDWLDLHGDARFQDLLRRLQLP